MGDRDPRLAALEEENERLRESLRVQVERLSRVAHDVRTPLHAILGAADLLGREEAARLSAQGKEDIATLRRSAHALVGLLDDLVGLAKLESGSFEVVVEELDVEPLLREALIMARAALGTRPVELIVHGSLARLRTDGLRLRHVALDMLLASARWQDGAVELHAHADDGAVVLSLDAPASALDGDDASLELAVVLEVGKVLGAQAALERSGDAAKLVVRFRAAGDLPRVLYIDDSAPNRGMVRRYLAGEFEVLEAGDAEAGIASAASERPDLILMDLSLPEVDGCEAARRIKSRPELSSIPIVAVSGYSGASDRERARSAGCVDYVTKPFDRTTLLSALRRNLGHAA